MSDVPSPQPGPQQDDLAVPETTEALAEADTGASLELAAATDPWIDLARAGTESEILMARLTDRYAEMNEAVIGAAASDPAALQGALRLLARQLARAQADVFVLKSAVLGRDRMVLSRDWDYRDPLQAHAQALGSDGLRAMWKRTGRYTLPLDDSLMGFGWYPTETNGRAAWRWSGPGIASTLLVPRFFAGRVKLEILFNSVRAGVMPESGGLIVDGRHAVYDLTFSDAQATRGTVSVTLDLGAVPDGEAGAPHAFLPIEFNLVRTYSPAQEFGKSDKRELGICLREVAVSVA